MPSLSLETETIPEEDDDPQHGGDNGDLVSTLMQFFDHCMDILGGPLGRVRHSSFWFVQILFKCSITELKKINFQKPKHLICPSLLKQYGAPLVLLCVGSFYFTGVSFADVVYFIVGYTFYDFSFSIVIVSKNYETFTKSFVARIKFSNQNQSLFC